MSARNLAPFLCLLGALGMSSCRSGTGSSDGESRMRPYWRGQKEKSPGRLKCSPSPAAGEVWVSTDRWPDASDLRRFGRDAVRLSGAKTEQEKCIAVWRWVRRWSMYTDGNPPTENAVRAKRGYVDGPLKVLNVYGTHWCDGLSRVVETVWRAMGYGAQKLYRGGHTMVDCQYRDSDGVARWHLFDVSEGGFTLHSSRQRLLSPDEMSTDWYNYMYDWVHCPHLDMPAHRMELDLRRGEGLVRRWGNFKKLYQDNLRRDHQTVPEYERGPYKIDCGNGRWSYAPDLSDPNWKQGLAAPPRGLAEKALAPAAAGKPATAVWDFRTPYIISDARVELDMVRKGAGDAVRLHLSTDGGRSWKQVWQAPAKATGRRKLSVSFCPKYKVTAKAKRPAGFHSPFGLYAYRLKLELVAAKAPQDCRVEAVRFVTEVQQNFYALPQLQPGKNRITVRGRLAPGAALKVTYLWDDPAGKGRKNVSLVEKTPHTYEIVAGGTKWTDVVCRSLTVEAVAASGKGNQVLVKEKPAPFRKLSPLPPAEKTRHRWRRLDARKVPPVAQLIKDARDTKKLKAALLGLIERRSPKGFAAAKRVAYEVQPGSRGKLSGIKELAMLAMYLSDRKKARPVLLDILSDEKRSAWKHDPKNPAVRGGHWTGGAAVIGYMAVESGWKEFVPGLARALQSPHCWSGARVGLLRTLGRLGDARAAEAVRANLTHKNLDVVQVAALAAGRVGDRKAIPRLKKLLSCGYQPTELRAARALGMLGEGSIAPRLRKWLSRRGDEDYRAVAAEALGALGDRKSKAALEAALAAEPFPWVREELRRALKKVR